MPFAVTHFVGSGLFNRALRYWARTAADQAKAVNTAADGFKLSDSGLVPIKKGPSEKRGDRSYQNTEVRCWGDLLPSALWMIIECPAPGAAQHAATKRMDAHAVSGKGLQA